MQHDQIEKFKQAKNNLLQRKLDLEQQLAQINDALASNAKSAPPRPARKQCELRGYGELTAAVISVLEKGPMRKREIIQRLEAEKFSFSGPPIKIVDSVIYTKHFSRSGKMFSLAKAAQ